MEDVFDFVEQFLGTAGTECRNEEGAMVSQGLICCLLEPLLAVSVVFMQAVAVGTFQHQDVGALWRFRRMQQRCVGRTKVSGEHNALAGRGFRVVDITLDASSPLHMPRTLKADIAEQLRGTDERMPLVVSHGNDGFLYVLEAVVYRVLVKCNAEFECIFQYQRQLPGRRLAADDQAIETRGEQLGNTPYMVDVNMADQQGLDALDREVDFKAGGRARLVTLKQAAMDQQAVGNIKMKLVTGAGYALGGAAVCNSGKNHTSPFNACLWSAITPQNRAGTLPESEGTVVGKVLFFSALHYSAS